MKFAWKIWGQGWLKKGVQAVAGYALSAPVQGVLGQYGVTVDQAALTAGLTVGLNRVANFLKHKWPKKFDWL